jgi:hypothetical protein
MKKIFIIIPIVFVLVFSQYTSHAFAQCAHDNDWPEKPCNDVIDPQNPKPIHGDKEDWKAYYSMKGKDWMESKKSEMNYAHENHILKEWYEFGKGQNNYANANVWYYYNLYGESPDIMQYYHGNVQENWLTPIITYYYVSPILFVIIGIASVVGGFFITKKLIWYTRK